MRFYESLERHRRKNIAVVNQDIVISDPWPDVAQATTSFEENGLMIQPNRRIMPMTELHELAIFSSLGKSLPIITAPAPGGILPHLRQMMGVHSEVAAANLAATLPCMMNQWLVHQRNQGLGQSMRQRLQPCAQSCPQQKRFRHAGFMPVSPRNGESFLPCIRLRMPPLPKPARQKFQTSHRLGFASSYRA